MLVCSVDAVQAPNVNEKLHQCVADYTFHFSLTSPSEWKQVVELLSGGDDLGSALAVGSRRKRCAQIDAMVSDGGVSTGEALRTLSDSTC